MPKFHASGSMTATRKSSETVLQWAAANVPELVGGSADLAPSTLTLIADGGSVEAGAYDGRNFHFGIREHAMGAIVNGLNAPLSARLRRHVLHVQRLHARLDPAGRADAPAVDLRVHARLDRSRRGRPHAPADRATRGTPGDAGAPGGPSCRRERDRARLALRDQVGRSSDRAGAVAPGDSDLEPVGDHRRTRSTAAPTCSATRSTSPIRRT